MTVYAITFRLEHDETWSDRYDSFMDAVRACKTVWAETTSFCLVETDETLEALERRLYLTQFSTFKDTMVVIQVSYDAAVARGKIKDKETLRNLLYGIDIK